MTPAVSSLGALRSVHHGVGPPHICAWGDPGKQSTRLGYSTCGIVEAGLGPSLGRHDSGPSTGGPMTMQVPHIIRRGVLVEKL